MPSVRYVPTGKFSQHFGGARLERIRFIIIDDDSNEVFCPRNFSARFGSSEKLRRYRNRLPQEEERLTGIKCIDSPVVSKIQINGRFCANIVGTKGSYLHASAGTGGDDIGGQLQHEEQDEEQRGRELFTNVHACYHQSQLSNISKFVCWSHGQTNCYRFGIALLFKEGTYFTAKFDWQQSPHATVFMYNDRGGVEKLAFGDETVSGLEFVSLGEPIGNYMAGDTSSFISLIPGSDRADQIFDTLVDKGIREVQRSRWDAGSAIMSSSQSTDDGCLMMKRNKKTLWAGRHHQPDFMDIVESKTAASKLVGKQLVRTQASGQAEIVFHSTTPPHRSLTWLPSKIQTQMANKVASFFPGGAPKSTKYVGDKDSPLAPVAPAETPMESINTASLGEAYIRESNKFKKAYERFPRLSRANPARTPSEKRSTLAQIDGLNPEAAVYYTRNDITGFCAKRMDGQALMMEARRHEGQGQKKYDKIMDNMHIPKLITDGKSTTYNTVHSVADGKRTHAANSNLGVSKAVHVVGDRKIPLITLEPSTPESGLRDSIVTFVLTEKKLVPPDFHTSGFGLRELAHTCVRIIDPAFTKSAVLQMAPIAHPDTLADDDPVFKNCKVQCGFDPIYPNGVTPKMEFERRVGGLENWYAFPMVQVAREYLPEGMKDTDWSWTDNGVSGEFIPGGIAW